MRQILAFCQTHAVLLSAMFILNIGWSCGAT